MLAGHSLMADSLLTVCESGQVGATSVGKGCMICYCKCGVSGGDAHGISGCQFSFAHTLCVTCSQHVANVSQPEQARKCPRCRGLWAHAIPKASVVWSLLSEEANEPPPRHNHRCCRNRSRSAQRFTLSNQRKAVCSKPAVKSKRLQAVWQMQFPLRYAIQEVPRQEQLQVFDA